jgi:sugar phosphate permease
MGSQTGYIPSMSDVGTIVGGIIIGYLGDKYARSYFLAPMMYFSAVMMLIVKIFLTNNPAPYYVVIFLMGLGLGGPYNIIGKFLINLGTVISIDLATH